MSDTYSNQYLIYDRMGIIHIKMQKYNKALRDFQKVIRLNSQYPEVFNHRGILNFTLGNYKLAKLDYDRAIKMDRDYAVAYYNRALLSLVLGNTEQAYKDLTIARGFNYLKATDIIEQFFVDK